MALHRTIVHPAVVALLPLTVALCPEGVQAQLRPGIERGDYWGEIRARYRSEVLEGVGATMESWLDAWNADDADAVLDTFAESGVLILGMNPYTGQDSIRAAFTALLLRAGPIQFGLRDFDVSGDMAFATTHFRYVENARDSGSKEVSGHLVWILIKHDSSWKIRSQIFPMPAA